MEPLLQADKPSTPFLNHMNKTVEKYEPAGELQRENLELRNGTLLFQELKVYDDEIEVIKSDEIVEKVLKEILIIREAQCDLIRKFMMNKENDSTNETDLNASENYSPGLIVGLMLGSGLGVIMTAFAIKMMTI
jgi:hypothetical protein